MKRLLHILVVCSLLVSSTVYAQKPTIERNTIDNTVKLVSFAEGAGPVFNNSQSVINQYLELENAYSWVLDKKTEITEETYLIRFDLMYKGIEVEHGAASIMIKGEQVSFVNANIFKDQGVSLAPTITEQDALSKALLAIDADEYSWTAPDALINKMGQLELTKLPKGELVLVQDFRPDDMNRQLQLAYRFDIYATKPLSRDLIYVDAKTGEILLTDPIIKHVSASGKSLYSGTVSFNVAQLGANSFEMYDSARLVSTYDMSGSTNLNNANEITSTNNTWPDGVAVDAHWGASKVYDYFLNVHNRNSYDGIGSDLYSVVNYGNNYNNAFWNGFAMVYGNGTGMFNSGFEPLASLDVCAHEIGHGVCQNTSGLVYNRESGAMNEGFSDIWGAVIENYAAPQKRMWDMGEELRTGALRSMSNPKLYNDPNTYDGQYWVTIIGCTPTQGNDRCGVHTNSGVLNHWFYLLTEGGKGTNDKNNDYEVPGIGVEKAAKIAYATELALSSTATYAEARTVSINAATTLYGACSREVEAVTRAWYAVNVGNVFAPCTPQIGFAIPDTMLLTDVGPSINVCPAVKQLSIPVRVIGNAPTGGNAVLTFAGVGDAVSGADYTIPGNTLTFNSGSTTPQNLTLHIYDNGDVTSEKMLKLYFTIAQNGSNAGKSYTYDTCYIRLLDIKKAPSNDTHVVRTVNKQDVSTKATTPFFSRNRGSRMQFIITADELAAAGVEPNTPIDSFAFNVTQKNSTQAFTGFTLKIDATNLADLSGNFATVTTVYYNGNYTTALGWNMLPLSTPLIWDGTSNLAIETCFNNSIAGNENDYVAGYGDKTTVTGVGYSNSASGCGLSFLTGFGSITKPVISLVQRVPIRAIETDTAESREWLLNSAQNVYYYNYNNDKLIASVQNGSTELGCTKAVVIRKGNGVVAMDTPFATTNKTVKEFQLDVSQNGHAAMYDMIVYFDTSELSGVTLSTAYIVGTNVTVDSMMDTTNSVATMATMVQGNGSIGYRASFNKVYQRYYVIDQQITIPDPKSGNVGDLDHNTNIQVDNNPFRDRIYMSYNLQQATNARVILYDITGRLILETQEQLDAGRGRFSIDVAESAIANGTYVLQVVTDTEILTQQVIKQ